MELKELLKQKTELEGNIEHDMYIDCGPNPDDIREENETKHLIAAEEQGLVLDYYRKEVGILSHNLEMRENQCTEEFDFNYVLKSILDEYDTKWREHKLFKEHQEKHKEAS